MYIETKRNIFSRLMSGDYGLALTYWAWGVLGGAVLSLSSYGVSILANRYYLAGSTTIGDVLLYGFYALIFVYSLMVAMGVYAASKTYQGNKVWSVLARIFITLGLIRLAVTIASPTGGQSGEELVRSSVMGMQANLPMEIAQGVELGSVKADGATLVYNVRLTQFASDPGLDLKPGALRLSDAEICTDEDIATMSQAGVTIQYVYHYSDWVPIDTHTIAPNYCKGAS